MVLEMAKKLSSEGLGRVEISKQLSPPAGAVGSMLRKLKRDRRECSCKNGSGRPRPVATQTKIDEVEAEVSKAPQIKIAAPVRRVRDVCLRVLLRERPRGSGSRGRRNGRQKTWSLLLELPPLFYHRALMSALAPVLARHYLPFFALTATGPMR